MRLLVSLLVATWITTCATSLYAEDSVKGIDKFLAEHWQANNVTPAGQCDDTTFLRRITLDLAGRVPTRDEVDAFLKDKSSGKRAKTIQRLLDGPEFALHFGNVLDQMIQGRYAGNEAFVDFMRKEIREQTAWDDVFRRLLLGPWDSDATKPAIRFLDRRAKNLDTLTVDTARVFFGVDISCAKCHDHPLVDDWSQEHFYGMASFFNRTTGGKGKIGEKTEGEVTFLGSDGKEVTAKMMFLSGRIVEEPKPQEDKKEKRPRFSRRQQLVELALEEKVFFSRSIVNRLWEYFFARGLVSPVDQMHSENSSAVPGLLEWLAADFAEHGYDLHRLVTVMVSTRAYQLSSQWQHETEVPSAELFAVARLRPLSQRQLAFSLFLATQNAKFETPTSAQSRAARILGSVSVHHVEQYLTIEAQASSLLEMLDPRTAEFQSSAEEALFMSNNETAQELFQGDDSEDNLAAQLKAISDTRELVSRAIRTLLSRAARDQELSEISQWFDGQKQERLATCQQLIWALATSAEFRFIH